MGMTNEISKECDVCEDEGNIDSADDLSIQTCSTENESSVMSSSFDSLYTSSGSDSNDLDHKLEEMSHTPPHLSGTGQKVKGGGGWAGKIIYLVSALLVAHP
jgi:hypothetical protein